MEGDNWPLCQVRMWRTQIEVMEIKSGFIWVRIMGRDPDELVGICKKDFPFPDVEVGSILHARVNTGARYQDNLKFSDWEPQ